MRDGAPLPDDVLGDDALRIEMNLPIDVVPNTTPPRFRWRQTIETPVGKRVQEHESGLPPAVENAVMDLIGIAKQLALENAELKKPKPTAVTPITITNKKV